MVDVSLYPHIKEEITDNFLILLEHITLEEFDSVWENCEKYITPHLVAPIIDELGGNTICIGVQDNNKGNIFYLDDEFGFFFLDNNIETFLAKLKDIPTD